MSLELHIDIKGDSRYPVDRKAIRDRIRVTLQKYRVKGSVSVSVSIIGDRKMHYLNNHYRQKDYATDVLSFPTYDPTQPQQDGGFTLAPELGLHLGDIVVSYPQSVKIASTKNRLIDEIVGDLVEHGLLHLMGIHHEE